MMVTSTGSEGLGEGGSLSSLASAIQSREVAEGEHPSSASVPGLVDQLTHVDALLARLVTREMGHKNPEVNGNPEPQGQARLRELEAQVVASQAAMQEMRSKFAKNRQILTCNWEQAEAEVRRLDEIYHDTVGQVVRELTAAPEVLASNSSLASLAASLQQARESPTAAGQQGSNGNANLTSRMSRSMVSNGSHANNGQVPGGMSQSQGTRHLTNSNTISGLAQAILSDPCLLKSPTPSLPSLLSSDLARQDMNANQSL